MYGAPLIELFSKETEPGRPFQSIRRTDFWQWSDGFERYDTAKDCGKMVAEQIMDETSERDLQFVVKFASYAAIQHPPLTGLVLLNFLNGAAEAVEQRQSA